MTANPSLQVDHMPSGLHAVPQESELYLHHAPNIPPLTSTGKPHLSRPESLQNRICGLQRSTVVVSIALATVIAMAAILAGITGSIALQRGNQIRVYDSTPMLSLVRSNGYLRVSLLGSSISFPYCVTRTHLTLTTSIATLCLRIVV